MSSVPERIPPQNLEAEQSVLGSMLIEQEAIFAATEIIRPADFYKEGHQKIFEAMLALSERGEPVDLVTLAEELKQKNPGSCRRNSLSHHSRKYCAYSRNVTYYAKIVREKAILRNLIHAATGIVSKCFEDSDDVEQLLDEAERSIFKISQRFRPKI